MDDKDRDLSYIWKQLPPGEKKLLEISKIRVELTRKHNL